MASCRSRRGPELISIAVSTSIGSDHEKKHALATACPAARKWKCGNARLDPMDSGFHDERLLARAMNAGSLGYVLKDNTADELVAGIKAAHDARTWISPALRGYVSIDETAAKFALLSRRERQILDLLSHGQSTDEVSVQLSLSPHTVRTHVKNAMKKLDASTRAHAVAIALRELSIR